MKLEIKRFIFYIFFLTILYPAKASALQRSAALNKEAVAENAQLLQRLDSLIANHDAIIARKEGRIAKLREDYRRAVSIDRRRDICRALYKEYCVYDPDSAMHYARESTSLARRANPADHDLIASCILSEVFIHATQGFGEEAIRHLESIDPSKLSNNAKLEYFQVGQYIYSTQALFNTNGNLSDPCLKKSNAFRDSLVRLDPNHLNEVLWAPIALQADKDSIEYHPPMREVELLKRAVDSATEPSRENAINAYWLSRHFKLMNDPVNMVRYLTLAAIYDTEIENREIAAITELAEWLFDNNDLDRAYTYLIYSSDQANAYRNRARVLNVSSLLPTIRDAYLEAIHQRDRKLRTYLMILVGLSLVLIGVAIYSIVENRRLRRARKELSRANDNLKDSVAARDEAIVALKDSNHALEESNAALSKANSQLSEAAKVKEELVAMSYRLASDHINALDEYRKKLLRKYKLKQMTELGAELSDQELIKDPYKDFYAALDHTVLSLYPDFIMEYNAMVSDDLKFDPEPLLKNRSLNTRLRIYALRRLGIDKSADIARMLNVSIRTVYNNR